VSLLVAGTTSDAGKSVLVAPKWLTELTEDDSKKFIPTR